MLRPKTGRTQVYPLARSVGDTVLCDLREERPPRNLSDFHQGQYCQLMHNAALWRNVGLRKRRLGVAARPCVPHALRHGCAQRLLEAGFSMKAIGDGLGHHDPASTAANARVNLARLRQVANLDLVALV